MSCADWKNRLRGVPIGVRSRSRTSAAMGEMQARADSAYVAANRRAPPAMPLERPDAIPSQVG